MANKAKWYVYFVPLGVGLLCAALATYLFLKVRKQSKI
jgi:hypothetical protein